MRPRLALVVALAFLLSAWLAGAPPAAAAWQRQEFEARVDAYPAAKGNVLRAHLRRALSRLRGRRSELRVAAAINSYVFQHLRHGTTASDGVGGLVTGYGLCGGAATTMVEMLYEAGIRSRHVALLGIPYQGNHSLVQVYLRRGRAGLFDPTFGVFWYSRRRKRPVPLEGLLRDPALSLRTLHKSRHAKRLSASDPVVPIAGVRDGYALRRGYRELPTERGRPRMDWELAFRVRGGAGIANSGRPVRARIRLRPGDLHGVERWSGAGQPWAELVHATDRSGLKLPWAFQLGRNGHGFDIVHSYRLSGLVPGRRYRLRLTLAQTRRATLRARLAGARRPLLTLPLRELNPTPRIDAPTVTIAFAAPRAATRLRVSVRGFAMLQAVALR